MTPSARREFHILKNCWMEDSKAAWSFFRTSLELNQVFYNHLHPHLDHALCYDEEGETQEQADGDREIEKKRNLDRPPESKPLKG